MKTMQASPHLWFTAALLALVTALAVVPSRANADELRFALSGDQEVPPVKTMATGTATVRVDPDMSITGQVATTGIAATVAHIHLGARGANGPVQIDLVRKGENEWVVPAGAKLTEAQYKAYKAGELYFNVHSAQNKAGELRGQIKP